MLTLAAEAPLVLLGLADEEDPDPEPLDEPDEEPEELEELELDLDGVEAGVAAGVPGVPYALLAPEPVWAAAPIGAMDEPPVG